MDFRLVNQLYGLAPVNLRSIRAALWAIALTIVLAAVSCGGSDIKGNAGQSLEVHIHPVHAYDSIAYISGGQTNVIRPSATNRQLAAVNIILYNPSSTTTRILADPNAAQLGDRRAQRIHVISPFENAVPVESFEAAGNERSLTLDTRNDDERFLWGEITLNRQESIQGWMIFDVPKGLNLSTFWWRQVEDLVVDL